MAKEDSKFAALGLQCPKVVGEHRRTVARLLPAHSGARVDAQMPDIVGRLQKVFGRKVIPDKAIGAVLDDSRGAY